MPESLTRPNGKTHYPRPRLRLEEYTDHELRTCLVVLFTHDLDRAREFAQEEWSERFDGDPMPAGEPRWMRLVPFDTGTGFDRNWVIDEIRGSACVVFDHTARDAADRDAALAARAVMP